MSAIPSLLRSLALRCLAAVSLCSALVHAAPGDVDANFKISTGDAKCLALQADGKILVASGNQAIGRQFARFNAAGEKDLHFNVTMDGDIRRIAVLPDGKILIAGSFKVISGTVRKHIARLLPDGSVDLSFNPGTDAPVSAIVALEDGSVLLGGEFTRVGGVARNRVARISASGALEAFAPALDGPCSTIDVQADGRVLLGGSFATVNGSARAKAARVSAEGVLEESFTPSVQGTLNLISEQSDGSILLAGSTVVRLTAAGAVDPTFQHNIPSISRITSIVEQGDGKILVGGTFQYQADTYCLTRLEHGGTMDPAFVVKGLGVETIAPTGNGTVLIGGSFYSLGGVARQGTARIVSDPQTSLLMAPDSASIEWQWSTTAALLDRVTFESRSGGSGWTPLGSGQRINGGWRLQSFTLPEDGLIRASGYRDASGNTSVYQAFLTIGQTQPQLTVEHRGTAVAPGGTHQLGRILTGFVYDFDFKLTNTGDRKLEQISVSGIVLPVGMSIAPPATLEPGESAIMRIRFRPMVEGTVTGSFTINSNAAPASHEILFTGISSNVISPVFRSPSDVIVPDGGILQTHHTLGQMTLEFAPIPGTILTLVAGQSHSFRIQDLPEGAIVNANFNGVTYHFVAGYSGGKYGEDITLTALGDGVIEKNFTTGGDDRNFYVQTTAMQGDGSIIVNRRRWDANGEADPVYSSGADPNTLAMLTEPNGDAYHASGPSAVPQLVRLRNDGSIDPTFSITLDGNVIAMAAQPDGKILIGGKFTTIGGQARPGIARIHRDGSLDTSFAAGLDVTSLLKTLAVQPDGKILLGGFYFPSTTPGGPTTAVARFLPDGSRDSTFSLDTPIAHQLLLQPDGKILVVVTDHSSFPFSPLDTLRRYLPDGSPDESFRFDADGWVRTAALLADGKFLVSGLFTRIGDHIPSGIVRILPDGSPDPTFVGTAGSLRRILLGSSNQPYLAGGGSVSGVRTPIMATISNPTATDHLERLNANTVRWMRQGAAAELQWVKAELIPQGSGEPISLGMAQRITGGWEITSATPISNATVRLSGPATNSGGMDVMVDKFLESGSVSHGVVVTRDQQVLPPAEVHDLGRHLLGIEKSVLLRMENRGAGTLETASATIEGPHAADFTFIQSSPADLRAGEQRSFRVKIKPVGIGVRTAQLVIRGSDPEAAIHVVPLRLDSRDTLDPVFTNAIDVPFAEPGLNAAILNLGTLTLNFAPAPRTVLKLFSNTGYSSISGNLADLPHLGYVTTVYNGVTYTFLASYIGGDGNDLTLRLVGVGDTVPWFAPAANGTGSGLAIQPDGKVLVGGLFSTIGGAPNQLLARLHPDGRADLSFNATGGNRTDSMVIQDDGRILIGGIFNTVNGVSRPGIARLEPDGTLDTSFDLRAANGTKTRVDTNRLLKLKNGKVLVGGQFTSLSNIPKQNIARLNEDGSLDETFTTTIAGTTVDTVYIYSMHEQPDGKLLIGGRFTSVNGVPRFGFARLNADGTLDTSLADLAIGPNPGPVPDGTETRVSAIVWQPDGKILFGGEFTSVLGQPRIRFARLNADGTLDTSFSPTANNTVSSLALQEDGRILASGLFTQASGQARTRVVRLNTDGSLDPEFQPEVNGTVSTLVMDRHGKVWVTGEFTTVSGLPTRGISKLENNGPGLSLSIENGTTAWWSAGASAPVLREVTFELSTDGGAIWSPLGNATKVLGGWSLENLTLPPHGFLRAKGYGIASNRTSSEIEETLLFGRPLTKIEQWRAETFGAPTNQRTGADLNDADKDGVKNLMEYAFNLDPQDSTSATVPAWTNDSSQFEIGFTPPANVEGVSYGAEWSSTMNPSDWHDVSNQGTGGDHRYVVPKDSTPLKFMRVKVTNTGSLPPP